MVDAYIFGWGDEESLDYPRWLDFICSRLSFNTGWNFVAKVSSSLPNPLWRLKISPFGDFSSSNVSINRCGLWIYFPLLWCQIPATTIFPLQESFKINKKEKKRKRKLSQTLLKSFALHKYVFLGLQELFSPCDLAIFSLDIPLFRFNSLFGVIKRKNLLANILDNMQHTPNSSNNKIINYFNFPFFAHPPSPFSERSTKNMSQHFEIESSFFCAMISWWCSKYKSQNHSYGVFLGEREKV